MASRPIEIRGPQSVPADGLEPGAAASAVHLALAEQVLSAAEWLRAGLASDGPLPSRRDVRILIVELLEVLFPESHRLGSDGGSLRDHVAATIATLSERLERAIYLGLHRHCRHECPAEAAGTEHDDDCEARARALAGRLLVALPDLRAALGR